MKKVDILRKKYSEFVYKNYSYKIEGNDLKVSFVFVCNEIQFSPKVIIQNIDKKRFKSINKLILDNLIFHLGLIEIPTYWKVFCSPVIKIECGSLNKEQIKWWKDLIFNGMGEFFYINNINFKTKNFLKIKCVSNSVINRLFAKELKDRKLVSIGGGKDSIVSLEMLREMGEDLNCFSLNPNAVIKEIMKIGKCKNPIIVKRDIDKKLLELNQKEFLNGHTPFSAYLAFLSILLGVIFDYKYLVFSNERSANQGNLKYIGREINHQYSKSFDFEEKFRKYYKKYLVKKGEYFSLLRPLYEIQIVKLFSSYQKYFPVFLSCNEAYKTFSGTRKPTCRWCGNCPKCLFVFICLYPFIDKKSLIDIFDNDLFKNKKLLPIMLQLIGEGKNKPFECVGTKEESLVAFYLSLKKSITEKKTPFLLNYFEERILPKYKHLERDSKSILNSWNEKNNLSDTLRKELERKNNIPTILMNKKILILGFGREGRDTLKFLRKLFPKKEIGIGDIGNLKHEKKNYNFIKWYLGKKYLNAINDYDLVIKSPGIPIHLPEIEKGFKDGKIISQTEIFLENSKGRIIGITGTKGKSTTASLIYDVLKKNNLKVHLVGNIGNPALSFLLSDSLKDIYVYELSCHQLYNIRRSPDISIFLNLFPEHLDYYKNFKEYAEAKENITRFQTKNNYLIFNSKNQFVKKIAKKSKANKIPINTKEVEKIIKHKNIPILGKFNLQNIAAAISVGKILNVSDKNINKAISDFKPLSHRLEFVGEYKKVKFYNDSLSTLPEATIVAIDTLGKDIETIILGGFDRGLDFKDLAKKILENKIKNVIFFPGTGIRIWKEIKKINRDLPKDFWAKDMREAVDLSCGNTNKGKICLLSCASPSFGLFKDYEERGNLFKKYVQRYCKK